MAKFKFTRRKAVKAASFGAAGTFLGFTLPSFGIYNPEQDKLALLGGPKCHNGSWPSWPVWDESAEKGIVEMLRTGKWWRGNGDYVIEFEKMYAGLIGSRRCLATASGTSALMVAMQALKIDAGDEVLVSPFTFIATYNVIMMNKALPVFVDSDPETFLIDPARIASRITDRTTAIMPVHIYGLPVDMDRVNAAVRPKGIKVIEDACQAWMGQYKGKKLGTLGDAGCFSFQNSKNLPAGEGGAIVSDNEELMDRCHSVHNCGRPYGSVKRTSQYPINGGNSRMQQIQALILMSQMKRIEKDTMVRHENAMYLNTKLKEIKGVRPFRFVKGAEISANHFFPFRYIKEEFENIPKETFIKALNAEGIPCSSGYGPQNREGLIEEALTSRGFRRLFPESRLKQWREENVLPGNDKLCSEAVIMYQNILLGSRSDMDDIANAVQKIYNNRKVLL